MPDIAKKTVSATQTPALFGESPYETRFTLWAEFCGLVTDDIQENQRMSWGKRLQWPVMEWVAEEYGLEVMPNMGDVYFRDLEYGVGCTADGLAFSPDRGLGFVEIKCVDYFEHRDKWSAKTAPRHIEIQHQTQLSTIVPYPTEDDSIVYPPALRDVERNELIEFISRFHGQRPQWGMIVCLVGGNDAHVIERLPSEKIIGSIRAEALAFLDSVAKFEKPPVVGDAMEFPALNALYLDMEEAAEPLTEAELDNVEAVRQLCADYLYWSAQKRGADKSANAAKAKIMEIMAERPWMRIPSFSVKISRSEVAAKIMALPKPLRDALADLGTSDPAVAAAVEWSEQIRKASIRASFNVQEIEGEDYTPPDIGNILA